MSPRITWSGTSAGWASWAGARWRCTPWPISSLSWRSACKALFCVTKLPGMERVSAVHSIELCSCKGTLLALCNGRLEFCAGGTSAAFVVREPDLLLLSCVLVCRLPIARLRASSARMPSSRRRRRPVSARMPATWRAQPPSERRRPEKRYVPCRPFIAGARCCSRQEHVRPLALIVQHEAYAARDLCALLLHVVCRSAASSKRRQSTSRWTGTIQPWRRSLSFAQPTPGKPPMACLPFAWSGEHLQFGHFSMRPAALLSHASTCFTNPGQMHCLPLTACLSQAPACAADPIWLHVQGCKSAAGCPTGPCSCLWRAYGGRCCRRRSSEACIAFRRADSRNVSMC